MSHSVTYREISFQGDESKRWLSFGGKLSGLLEWTDIFSVGFGSGLRSNEGNRPQIYVCGFAPDHVTGTLANVACPSHGWS